jgi:hypothetical protein
MPTVQIQLILENYLVIIVPCMAKTREYSGAFTDNENAESPSVLANPQIDWNSCIRPTKSGNRFQWKYHGL